MATLKLCLLAVVILAPYHEWWASTSPSATGMVMALAQAKPAEAEPSPVRTNAPRAYASSYSKQGSRLDSLVNKPVHVLEGHIQRMYSVRAKPSKATTDNDTPSLLTSTKVTDPAPGELVEYDAESADATPTGPSKQSAGAQPFAGSGGVSPAHHVGDSAVAFKTAVAAAEDTLERPAAVQPDDSFATWTPITGEATAAKQPKVGAGALLPSLTEAIPPSPRLAARLASLAIPKTDRELLIEKLEAEQADPAAGFAAWCTEHGKTYDRSTELGAAVYEAYLSSLAQALEHNRDEDATFWLDTNNMLDWQVLKRFHGRAKTATIPASTHRRLMSERSLMATKKSATKQPPPSRAPKLKPPPLSPKSKPPPGPPKFPSPAPPPKGHKNFPPPKKVKPPPASRNNTPPPPTELSTPAPFASPSPPTSSSSSPPPTSLLPPIPLIPAPTPPPGDDNTTLFYFGNLNLGSDFERPQSPSKAGNDITCPDSVDNRKFLQAPRDQGQCGSCWTFGSTAAVEAAYAKATGGTIIDLSEEQLVDCAISTPETGNYENAGCEGGFGHVTFAYLKSHGQVLEKVYPYTQYNYESGYDPERDRCATEKLTGGVRLSRYAFVPQNEDAMKELFCTGVPVLIVSVNACENPFMAYRGGIFSGDCPGQSTNHLVSLVGYGTDSASGKQYWILRNSWGTSWGEGGYMRIEMARNLVRINSQVLYPTLDLTTVTPAGPTPDPGPGPSASPPPPANPDAKCNNQNVIRNGAATAVARCSWGLYYAAAYGADCSYFGYAWEGETQDEVDEAALQACNDIYDSKGYSGNCQVLSQGVAECVVADEWQPAVEAAQMDTAWGYYYSVSMAADCSSNGYYRYNYRTQQQADRLAVEDCNLDAESKATNPCGLVANGYAACTDSDKLYQYADTYMGKTSSGKYWAIAIGKDCARSYASYNYATLSEAEGHALASCNSAYENQGFGKYSCGAAASGKVPGNYPTKCESRYTWAETSAAAFKDTGYNHYWAVAIDKGCSDPWYGSDWDTQLSAVNGVLKACNDYFKSAGYGSQYCDVVDGGRASCADSDTWDYAASLAKSNNAAKYYWAVAMSKDCEYWWAVWNYQSSSDATSAALQGCSEYFDDATQCGIVAKN